MNDTATPHPPRPTAREKLLVAARDVIRAKGYAATSVEDLCNAAGVTKGAFFHHFASKEALAVAVVEFWNETTGVLFAGAPYHAPEDPLERIRAYLDFRLALVDGALPAFTCLAGTLVQETYATNPAIRQACAGTIAGHAGTLVDDIAAAKAIHAPEADWTPEELALHSQAVIQGGFILAKALDDPEAARASIRHLRRYLDLLFTSGNDKGNARG